MGLVDDMYKMSGKLRYTSSLSSLQPNIPVRHATSENQRKETQHIKQNVKLKYKNMVEWKQYCIIYQVFIIYNNTI